MTAQDDIDTVAAEYVIGTLDASERTAVAARRPREPALDQAIRAWEQRLAPLDSETPAVEPPADLLQRIESRLAGNGAGPRAGADIIRLERRVARWRRTAVGAMAMAASLLLAIGARETVLAPQPQSFVAVFQKDDAQPSFLLTIDLATRQLTVRPVAAQRPDGRIFQLWIASDQLGPGPRSLGLLDETADATRKSLDSYPASLLQKATFGVSVEPPGGSPNGRPSGSPLHAKLYPATQ